MTPELARVLIAPVNLLFFALMAVLAFVDIATYFWRGGESHRNFKGEIVGLGILGTFWGIFVGLQHFDPNAIEKSIPTLLDGLKTAFLTSIAGMSTSMVLTVFQAMIRTKSAQRADDPLQAALDDILVVTRERASSERDLLEQVKSLRTEQRDESLQTRATFEKSFATMNAALDEALKKLSEGASREIIKALEDVIRDFNANLTTQFGDNFKELNAACLKLVEWQENYRVMIAETEKGLQAAIGTIKDTELCLTRIAERQQAFEALCERLGDIISTSDTQTQLLNDHLDKQRQLAVVVERGLLQAQGLLTQTSEQVDAAIGHISGEMQRMNQEQHAQFANLSRTFEEHCATITTTFSNTSDGLTALSQKMQGALTQQSAALADLTQKTADVSVKTRNELDESLRQMNNALTSLTTQFGANYREFLNGVARLMPK